ncbi:MAG: hypothetical protein H6744_15495 [Deltaproteobacteria bacterium]|nr:hypothetical protein [Deltaproteobacteria bacterium]MCB9788086.1 hypothetical protein [Deltaproteobacteria bacterium]
MSKPGYICAIGLLTLLAAPARAEDSPRHMMLELHVGPYKPGIDDQFVSATPYRDNFGSSSMILFGFHLDYQLFQKFGSLALGGGVRFGTVKGHAVDDAGVATTDKTKLRMMPLQADLTYRFDYAALQWGVPLVPYARGGLTYALWWVLNGRGEIASAYGSDGNGHTGRGGTWGWHAAVGLQFLLDWIDSSVAREFDEEVGVNNSYLFAEVSFNGLNDFGSGDSFELSDRTVSFGLMFEF